MRMTVEIACTIRSRLVGLLGRPPSEGALLIVPCRDVHTFGMRHALDIAFLSADGAVVASYRQVEPHRRLRHKEAVAVVERFSSDDSWLAPGERLQWETVAIERKGRGAL